MKLCRYGKPGYEKPGVIDGEGRLRDLSKVIDNIGPNEISPRQLRTLSQLKPETMPLVNGMPRYGVPYVGIGKFIAIGLNYSDHAKEAGLPIPSEPIVFMKATTCISGPSDDVIQPKNSTKLDWEIELGVVIGTQARYVDEASALNHVAGDVIATGTPPGVGLGMKPTPVFLKPGDVMRLTIAGLGEQKQRVVAYSA